MRTPRHFSDTFNAFPAAVQRDGKLCLKMMAKWRNWNWQTNQQPMNTVTRCNIESYNNQQTVKWRMPFFCVSWSLTCSTVEQLFWCRHLHCSLQMRSFVCNLEITLARFCFGSDNNSNHKFRIRERIPICEEKHATNGFDTGDSNIRGLPIISHSMWWSDSIEDESSPVLSSNHKQIWTKLRPIVTFSLYRVRSQSAYINWSTNKAKRKVDCAKSSSRHILSRTRRFDFRVGWKRVFREFINWLQRPKT